MPSYHLSPARVTHNSVNFDESSTMSIRGERGELMTVKPSGIELPAGADIKVGGATYGGGSGTDPDAVKKNVSDQTIVGTGTDSTALTVQSSSANTQHTASLKIERILNGVSNNSIEFIPKANQNTEWRVKNDLDIYVNSTKKYGIGNHTSKVYHPFHFESTTDVARDYLAPATGGDAYTLAQTASDPTATGAGLVNGGLHIAKNLRLRHPDFWNTSTNPATDANNWARSSSNPNQIGVVFTHALARPTSKHKPITAKDLVTTNITDTAVALRYDHPGDEGINLQTHQGTLTGNGGNIPQGDDWFFSNGNTIRAYNFHATAPTNGYMSSDVRLKRDIQDHDTSTSYAVVKASRLRTYTYIDEYANWRYEGEGVPAAERGTKRTFGWIADELEELDPELTHRENNMLAGIYTHTLKNLPDMEATFGNGQGIKHVHTTELLKHLYGAVQVLMAKVEALEAAAAAN